ncbi:MAG: SagB/ThcOx family dehydrogenase [candidate division Zixibacteria bacterium]|nr:SagB/ThcOx family dehydrogenase [candidate division Zixibacteria bacterium]
MRFYPFFILLFITFFMPLFAVNGDSLSIGPRFHRETGYDEYGMVGKNISWGENMPLYKEYPEAGKIKLPLPSNEGKSVERAIRERQSVRLYSSKTVSLEHLAQVLFAAAGLTHTMGEYALRAAPSGGALYPIETYFIVDKVENLPMGLYHYQVADSSLALLKEGYFNKDIHIAANEQKTVGNSPLTIILTARFARSTRKYADRGYRYIYMEAGAICENIYLEATSLDMGTVAVGAFNDALVNEILEIDGRSEAALLIMPLGYLKDK